MEVDKNMNALETPEDKHKELKLAHGPAVYQTTSARDVSNFTQSQSHKGPTCINPKEINNKNGDVESGKVAVAAIRRRSVFRVSWRKAVVMLVCAAVFVGLASVLWYYLGWLASVQLTIIVAIVYFLQAGGWRWLYVAFKTAPRDIKAIICYIKLLWMVRVFNKKNWTIPDIFRQTVAKHPDKQCFLYQDEVWTFAQVEEYSLRVTAVLKSHGYGAGKTIAIFVPNCPQLVTMWLGVSRFGGVSPLINTNQRGKALLHSINIAKCDAVIYSEELEQAIQEISQEISPTISLYRFSHRPLNTANPSNLPSKIHPGTGAKDFTALLESTAPVPDGPAEGNGFHGKLVYIYTSGTTGLPKAAVISHSRFIFMVSGMHYLGGFQHSDIVYCPLPLYHTAGGIMSVGQALVFGMTVVIRNKFSASAYIPDCIKYGATVGHYIGEMCRYILATPPSPTDKQHKLRVIYGNGLRPQIWTQFVERFNIPRVAEFYGATEGNANIVNIDGRVGAIGFVSRIIPAVYPIAIIKVDPDTGEPIRNSNGLCQLCKPNEPGVFIGKIQPNNPSRAFLGYVDEAASAKKVVRDVFSHGDEAFISGDLLVADEFGYLFFKDRTGDTFRWRGENVSTSEVEAAVSQVAGQRDAVVYGVLVPNVEGRAGMCGIVDPERSLELKQLGSELARDLPPYARPVFLRVMHSVDMTGTFKMKKRDLQLEGFDPSVIKDELYYLEPKLGQYVPLKQDDYNKICSGQIRL